MAADPILLVDDSKEDLELNRLALEEAGCLLPIELAPGGREAVARLQRPPRPKLVVLDLRMPLMDGLEVLRWAREQAPLRGLSIVVLTTSSLERDRAEALALGAAAYFEKPVDFDGTIAVARKLIALAK